MRIGPALAGALLLASCSDPAPTSPQQTRADISELQSIASEDGIKLDALQKQVGALEVEMAVLKAKLRDSTP